MATTLIRKTEKSVLESSSEAIQGDATVLEAAVLRSMISGLSQEPIQLFLATHALALWTAGCFAIAIGCS